MIENIAAPYQVPTIILLVAFVIAVLGLMAVPVAVHYRSERLRKALSVTTLVAGVVGILSTLYALCVMFFVGA